MTTVSARELDRLLKLRVVVARFGEMDLARWWNTNGQLSRLGAATLRRGLPRTHHFAQARSVFAVAEHRCAEIYDPPNAVTLWRLPADIEQAFDARWEHWLDDASTWAAFFAQVEELDATDLAAALRHLDLTTDADLAATRQFRPTAGGRAVQLPGDFTGSAADLSALALGFSHGAPGQLAVPYQATSTPA